VLPLLRIDGWSSACVALLGTLRNLETFRNINLLKIDQFNITQNDQKSRSSKRLDSSGTVFIS
jgi:hypothetical protein